MSLILCKICQNIMVIHVDQTTYKYRCSACEIEQIPNSAVLISGGNESQSGNDRFQLLQQQILINPFADQQVSLKCKECDNHLFIHQTAQKTLLRCICSQQESPAIPDAFKPGRTSKPVERQEINRFYAQKR